MLDQRLPIQYMTRNLDSYSWVLHDDSYYICDAIHPEVNVVIYRPQFALRIRVVFEVKKTYQELEMWFFL